MAIIRKLFEDRIITQGDNQDIYPATITKGVFDETTKETLDVTLARKQNETDERLVTESKEVVGAINELANRKTLEWSEF